MREGFRKNLEEYGAIAKKQLALEPGSSDQTLIWELFDLADEKAKDRETSFGTQLDVAGLQKQKQEVMVWLKTELKKIENKTPLTEKEIEPKKRWVVFHDGMLFWQSGEKEMEITFGEVLTDLDWEIEYQFDPVSVPRDFRKQYLVEQAKHKLKKLLDRQITRHEKDSKKIDEFRRKAYTGLFEEQRGGRETRGHLAEKMVRNFIKKISLDLDLGLDVIETDVHQDVEDKVDFILRRRNHDRGVRVEETEIKQGLGIQFTTDMSIDAEFRKRKQLERVKKFGSELALDDLILIRIDLNNLVIPAIRDWEKQKPPGGPDRFLPTDIKRKIFFELLKNIFKKEEIENVWSRVENN